MRRVSLSCASIMVVYSSVYRCSMKAVMSEIPATLPENDRERELALHQFFEIHGISATFYRHPPVYTVDESQQLCADIPGYHVKNLVVKDKKGRIALATVGHEKRVDLKALAADLGMGRLSFLRAEAMTALLGVDPGSVTPLAVINAPCTDPEADPPLSLVLDSDLWDADLVAVHPLHNRATVTMTQANFRRALDAAGYRETQRTVLAIPEVASQDK